MLRDAWVRPEKFPTMAYVGYVVANLLGTIGGKSWSVEERLYQFSAFLVCLAMVLVSLKKKNELPHPIRC
jgi:hypothetical protein